MKRMALFLSLSALALPAWSQSKPKPPVAIFPIQVQRELHPEDWARAMADLEDHVNEAYGDWGKVFWHQSSNSFLVKPFFQKENSKVLEAALSELLQRVQKNPDLPQPEAERSARKDLSKSRELPREVVYSVQIVRAQKASAKIEDPLYQALAKKFGFGSFETLAQTQLRGIRNDHSGVETRLPWKSPTGKTRWIELGLGFKTEARAGGDVVSASLKINEIGPPKSEDPEDRLETELQTTFVPRPGRPLVLGASPLDGDSSLVVVVTYEAFEVSP